MRKYFRIVNGKAVPAPKQRRAMCYWVSAQHRPSTRYSIKPAEQAAMPF